MDPDVLRSAVEHAGIASAAVAMAAGFLFSFNPVALAAIPVSMAYVTRARAPGQAVLFGSLFILGIIAAHILLGFITGLGGRWVGALLGRQWGLLLGPILIVLGLLWAGWIRLPMPATGLRVRRPAGAWGAFLLGVPFSVAICPVCTPALVVLLGVSASLGSPWFGAFLLLAFALGRAVPIVLGAVSLGWLTHLRVLSSYQRAFQIVGGLTLIASGLYMLNSYFFWLPGLA